MATIPADKLRTPDVLTNLAKRFAPVEVQPDEDNKPVPHTDIFSELALDRNIELDEGDLRTYDVQPDTRPLAATIAHEINAIYPDLNIKGHPIITPMSYLGYCYSLIGCLALLLDTTVRHKKSFSAQFWMDDRDRKDFYKRMQHLRIPAFLAAVLIGLSPVKDPRRTGHQFVFTLAAFLHKIDFGRIFPINAFFSAHDLLARTRSNIDPEVLLHKWYNITVYTHGTSEIKNGNLFGTAIRNRADASAHRRDNFMTSFIETAFNGVTARFHSSRPTFKKTPLTAPTYASAPGTHINGYDYFFGLDDSTSPVDLLSYLEACSKFIESDDPKTAKLGLFIGSLSSISILSHVISPPILPTFHRKTVASKVTDPDNVTELTDTQFASTINFLQHPDPPPNQTETAYKEKTDDGKSTNFDKALYLVDDRKITAATTSTAAEFKKARKDAQCPDKYLLFDVKKHVTPRVRIFDPYDVNPSKMAFPILCGLYIEHAEIDGFCVPLPHEKTTLHEENSFALQAGIPASKIVDFSRGSSYTAIERPERLNSVQPISISLYNMAVNRLPRFLRNPFYSTGSWFSGFTATENIDQLELSFNRFAFDAEDTPTIPEDFIFLWSAYRVLTKHRKPLASDIFVISSFRGIYGTNVTLAESRHPFDMIPH